MNTLISLIEKFQIQDPCPGEDNVRLYWHESVIILRAKKALRNMSTENRILFFKRLCFCWNYGLSNCTSNDKFNNEINLEELRSLFGDSIDTINSFIPPRLLFTVVGSKTQLRCWYGIPGRISYNHAESCGSGCLFSIEGSSVWKYEEGLLSNYPPFITLENGGHLYGISVNR